MTDIEVWADNATGTLGAPGTTGQTSISVAQSTGVFPTITMGEVFHLVIDFNTIVAEVVKVTATTGSAELGWSMTLAAPGLVNDHNGPPSATVAQVITKDGLNSMVAESVLLATYTTDGDLVYGTGASTVSRLGIGSTSQVLTVVGGIPAWVTGTSPTGAAGGDLNGTYPDPTIASIQGVVVSGTPAAGQGLYATSPTAAAWSDLTLSEVGTVFAADGDLLIGTGAGAGVILSAGTTGQVLTMGATEPEWADVSFGSDTGALGSPFDAIAGNTLGYMSTASLAIGTWLINATVNYQYGGGATGHLEFTFEANTAVASSISGSYSGQAVSPGDLATEHTASMSFAILVEVSTAGTFNFMVNNTDVSVDASILNETASATYTNCTGFTAVKVA